MASFGEIFAGTGETEVAQSEAHDWPVHVLLTRGRVASHWFEGEREEKRPDIGELQADSWRALTLLRSSAAPSWNAIAASWSAIAALTREVAELREELHRYIRSETDHGRVALPLDTVEAWIRSNWNLLNQHAGEIVAIHPQEGIVASGSDYAAVVAQVRQKGRENSVVIRFVRRK